MKRHYSFLDWRPVEVLPTCQKCYWKQEWTEHETLELAFRYVCFNDGIMLFQIKFAMEVSPRYAVVKARDLAYLIKKKTGHRHYANRASQILKSEEFYKNLQKFNIYPVLTEDFLDYNEPLDNICDLKGVKWESFIKCIKSRRIKGGEVSDRPAPLALKLIYSKIYNRSMEKSEYIDERGIKEKEFIPIENEKIKEKIKRVGGYTSKLSYTFYFFGLIFILNSILFPVLSKWGYFYIYIISIFMVIAYVTVFVIYRIGNIKALYNKLDMLKNACIIYGFFDIYLDVVNKIYNDNNFSGGAKATLGNYEMIMKGEERRIRYYLEIIHFSITMSAAYMAFLTALMATKIAISSS